MTRYEVRTGVDAEEVEKEAGVDRGGGDPQGGAGKARHLDLEEGPLDGIDDDDPSAPFFLHAWHSPPSPP